MAPGDDLTIAASSDRQDAPRLYAPLPGRTEDASATFERCLATLIDLLGLPAPALTSTGGRALAEWQNRTRRVIAESMGSTAVQDGWFEPLVRAAVYDPDPSFNRQLIEPALAVFGRRRVQLALLDYLKTGTNPERAGAARAWYWTQVRSTNRTSSETPAPESQAEHDACADLRREWRDTALQVFVANEDLDVRRCILPGLDLQAQRYPEELRARVAEAIHIARTHLDEYLRHRVEHQV